MNSASYALSDVHASARVRASVHCVAAFHKVSTSFAAASGNSSQSRPPCLINLIHFHATRGCSGMLGMCRVTTLNAGRKSSASLAHMSSMASSASAQAAGTFELKHPCMGITNSTARKGCDFAAAATEAAQPMTIAASWDDAACSSAERRRAPISRLCTHISDKSLNASACNREFGAFSPGLVFISGEIARNIAGVAMKFEAPAVSAFKAASVACASCSVDVRSHSVFKRKSATVTFDAPPLDERLANFTCSTFAAISRTLAFG